MTIWLYNCLTGDYDEYEDWEDTGPGDDGWFAALVEWHNMVDGASASSLLHYSGSK